MVSRFSQSIVPLLLGCCLGWAVCCTVSLAYLRFEEPSLGELIIRHKTFLYFH